MKEKIKELFKNGWIGSCTCNHNPADVRRKEPRRYVWFMGAWSYYIVVHRTSCGRFQESDCKESHLGKSYSVGFWQRNRNCDYVSCMMS